MTRLAILADIHGNLPALEAVIADMQQFNVDHVVVAGDSINWGPFSAEVMARITDLNWSIIRGNNELYLLDYNTPRMPEHWQSYVLPPWLRATIPPRFQHIIASMPDTLQLRFTDAPTVRVVHGAPGNHWVSMSPMTPDEKLAELLHDTEETTVIAAHTHLVMDRQVGRWHVINPGTVGVPLDGIHTARYAILDSHPEGWNALPRQVVYDIAPLLAFYENAQHQPALGLDMRLLLEEFKQARLRVHPYNLWHREHFGSAPKTRATVDEFLRLDESIMEKYMSLEYRRENMSPNGKGSL
jgi:predicted phosphodiesterase